MRTKLSQKLRAFTLIELLITIVILAILAGITIIALNPGQNIDDANDVKRRADVSAILNGVWQFAIDNDGTFPAGITSSTLAVSSVVGQADICSDLVTDYLAAMPQDPTTGSYTDCTTYATGYSIAEDASGQRITVTATLSDASSYTQTR